MSAELEKWDQYSDNAGKKQPGEKVILSSFLGILSHNIIFLKHLFTVGIKVEVSEEDVFPLSFL